MKDKLTLIIKGALIGVSNIIPGVSGGALAITLGLYEQIISSITNFFKNFKKNMLFLAPIGLGMIMGIVLVSNLITEALDLYPIETNVFFIFLILGGMPILLKKLNNKKTNYINWFIFVIVIVGLVCISFISPSTQVSFENMNMLSYFKLFIVGIIGSATMVIPGISGSVVLMLLGYYRPILDTINAFFNSLRGTGDLLHNFFILFAFGLGIIIGIIIIAKIVEYFLNKFETQTYYAIVGFVLGSIILIIKSLVIHPITLPTIIYSTILGLIGFTITYKLGSGD